MKLFQIFLLGAGLDTISVAATIYLRHKKSQMEATKDAHFSFIFMSLAFFTLALPQLVIFNPVLVQKCFILSDVLFLISELFLGSTLLKILDQPKMKKIFLVLGVFWVIAYLFLNWAFFNPALPLISEGKIYYWMAGTIWLQGLSRAFLVLGALAFAVIFFHWTRQVEEKRVSLRSLMAGLSMFSTAAGGFMFWFLPTFFFSTLLLALSTALNFFGILAITVFSLSFYLSSGEEFKKNEKI